MRSGLAVALPLALVALLTCGGCGSSSEKPYVAATVPVKGKVTYRGRPLPGGGIKFEPDGGREAHGSIGPDGTFELTTFRQGDGAVPGTHRVAVTGTPRVPLPLKFKNTSSSKIEVEVSEGKSDYTIDLK